MQLNRYHGRFAPSPTGQLDMGGASEALIAWCAARHVGGFFTLRIEELDESRTVAGTMESQIYDLRWLEPDWDAGPDIGGSHGPYLQSRHQELYQSALDQLYRQGVLFPCNLSRKDVQSLACTTWDYGNVSK